MDKWPTTNEVVAKRSFIFFFHLHFLITGPDVASNLNLVPRVDLNDFFLHFHLTEFTIELIHQMFVIVYAVWQCNFQFESNRDSFECISLPRING